MSRLLKRTVAALALGSAIALPAMLPAQEEGAAGAGANTPAATAPAEAQLPQALQELNLSDVQVRKLRRGMQRVRGTLEDGTRIQAILDDEGALRGAFAADGNALPEALTRTLIPETVRAQEIMGQFSSVSAAFGGERGIMVGGTDAAGERIRAGFAQDGTLMRFGRGDDRHGKPMHGARHDDDRHGKADRHHPGKPGHWDRRGGHGPKGQHRGPEGRSGLAPLTDDAVRGAVAGAGYGEIGEITHRGPHSVVEAVNPQGDPVRVEVSPRGEVIRETAR